MMPVYYDCCITWLGLKCTSELLNLDHHCLYSHRLDASNLPLLHDIYEFRIIHNELTKYRMQDSRACFEIREILNNRCVDGGQGLSPCLCELMAYSLQIPYDTQLIMIHYIPFQVSKQTFVVIRSVLCLFKFLDAGDHGTKVWHQLFVDKCARVYSK